MPTIAMSNQLSCLCNLITVNSIPCSTRLEKEHRVPTTH